MLDRNLIDGRGAKVNAVFTPSEVLICLAEIRKFGYLVQLHLALAEGRIGRLGYTRKPENAWADRGESI